MNDRELVYYYLSIPFTGAKGKEEVKSFKIIGKNDKYCVINDYSFTSIKLKYDGCDRHNTLNSVTVYKINYGWADDGYRAYLYTQSSEKVARRKIFNALKKVIEKDRFMSEMALESLKKLLLKK